MPLARIITADPERSNRLRNTLAQMGYEVEVVAHRTIAGAPADFEFDDSDPNAQLTFPHSDEVGFPEQYAAPQGHYRWPWQDPNREFILAPAWQKMSAPLKSLWRSLTGGVASARKSFAEMEERALARREQARIQDEAQAAVSRARQEQLEREQREFAEQRAMDATRQRELESERQRELELQRHREAELQREREAALARDRELQLKQQRERELAAHSALETQRGQARAFVQQLREERRREMPSASQTAVQPSATLPQAAAPISSPALVRAALALEAARARAAHHWHDWRTPRSTAEIPRQRPYFWRQAMPIAAGVLLAFVLGFAAAATHSDRAASAPQQQKASSRPGAGVTVIPGQRGVTIAPSQRPSTQRPSPATPAENSARSAHTAQNTHRRTHSDDDVADDVVVHHYRKQSDKITVAQQADGVKRISDQ
jgi:hypothetical protein